MSISPYRPNSLNLSSISKAENVAAVRSDEKPFFLAKVGCAQLELLTTLGKIAAESKIKEKIKMEECRLEARAVSYQWQGALNRLDENITVGRKIVASLKAKLTVYEKKKAAQLAAVAKAANVEASVITTTVAAGGKKKVAQLAVVKAVKVEAPVIATTVAAYEKKRATTVIATDEKRKAAQLAAVKATICAKATLFVPKTNPSLPTLKGNSSVNFATPTVERTVEQKKTSSNSLIKQRQFTFNEMRSKFK